MARSPIRITRPEEDVDGYAVVTVLRFSPTESGVEFALRRHGFREAHLGPVGWQVDEHWFAATSSWQSEEGWKVLLAPTLTSRLQEMPFEFLLRAGESGAERSFTLVWPGLLASVPEEKLPWGALQTDARRPEPPPILPRKNRSLVAKVGVALVLLVAAGVLLPMLFSGNRPRPGSDPKPAGSRAGPPVEPAARQETPAPWPEAAVAPDLRPPAETPPAAVAESPVPRPPPPNGDLEEDLKAALGDKLGAELEERMGAGSQPAPKLNTSE